MGEGVATQGMGEEYSREGSAKGRSREAIVESALSDAQLAGTLYVRVRVCVCAHVFVLRTSIPDVQLLGPFFKQKYAFMSLNYVTNALDPHCVVLMIVLIGQ